jgi:ribosomal protein L9
MRILKTILLLTITAFSFSCNNSSSKRNQSFDNNSTQETRKSAAELRRELKQKEQSDPNSYLSITTAKMNENITQKPDLFHHTKKDGWVLFGSITCKSTIARFKDVVIAVKYFSETNTEMNSQEYVIYKYFEPNSVTPFEYKIYPPDGFKTFTVILNRATPAD